MSTKITKPSGRESLEEFGTETREGDSPPASALSKAERMQRDASSTFPTRGERLARPVNPRSTSLPSRVDSGAQNIEEFEFLQCDPIELEDTVDPCAVCAPNEHAYVPEWRLMQNGEVFFDGKACTQNIIVTVPSPVLDGPTVSKINGNEEYRAELKRRGIRLLLDYFNKSDVATIFYYIEEPVLNSAFEESAIPAMGAVAGAIGGALLGNSAFGTYGAILGATGGFFVGGAAGELLTPPDVKGYILTSEERDVVQELLKYTEIDYSVPIQLKARTRVKISVPVEYFERIPRRLEVEPTTEFETKLEVTIDGNQYFPYFRRSCHALNVFANQYDRWVTLDGGSLIEMSTASADASGSKPKNNIPVHVDLRDQADMLEAFRDNIAEMIKEATGLTFRGFNQLEKITFKFEEPEPDKLRLVQVIVNKPGCPDIIFSEDSNEYHTKGIFKSYMKMAPFKQSRVLYYVGSLPEMDIALQAREPMPWLEFVTKFTYPGLEVFYGESTSSLMNDVSMLECFADSTLGDTAVDEFIDAMLDIGLGIPDAILAQFSESTCKTREEVRKEWKEISQGDYLADFKEEMRCQYRRAMTLEKTKIEQDDPWLEKVLEAIQEQKAAVNAVKADYQTTIPADPAYGKCGKAAKVDKSVKLTRAQKQDRRKKIKDEKDLWRRINDKLGWCGWAALVMSAIDCVAQGLTEENALDALVGAAFDAMSNAHFERVLVGLDPETQKAIQALAEEELGAAITIPPWDMAFVPGSYSGPGFDLVEWSEENKLSNEINKAVKENRDKSIEELAEYWTEGGVDPDNHPDWNNMTEEQLNNQISMMDEDKEATMAESGEHDWGDEADAQINLEEDTANIAVDTPPEYEDQNLYSSSSVLREGSSGTEVKNMQNALIALGYDLGSYGADGQFGPTSEAALKQFQADYSGKDGYDFGTSGPNNNGVDGIAGPTTTAALNAALNEAAAAAQNADWENSVAEFVTEEGEVLEEEAAAKTGEEDEVTVEDILASSSAEIEPPTPDPTPSDDPAFGLAYSSGNFSFGDQSPGSGGTYGTALGNVQKATFDAYRNAMLKSVGADVLLNEMSKLPGAAIVGSFLKHLPCKPPGPFAMTPQLDSFLNTLELGLNMETCEWDKGLNLPMLNCPKEMRGKDPDCPTFEEAMLDLFKMMGEAIVEAIKAAALAMMLQALKLVLQKVFQMSCDIIAMGGANLLDLFSGSDHFKNLLKENMCPDATDDQMYDALKGILSTIAPPGSSCLETLTNAELGAFIDDLSMMLTQGQVLELMTGNPSQETLTLAMEVAAISDSECIREIFSDPSAFGTLFPSLGIFVPNVGELRDQLTPGAFNRSTNPCPPDIREKIEDLKCELLKEKGLNRKQCRDQLDDLKDQALQDLKDLADMLQNGPLANFPPLTSAGNCPSPGFYPSSNPLLDTMNGQISAAMFERLEESHLRDLMGPLNWFTGRGGVLNAIMADTKGRPWKMHNWMVATFGSPIARDLGFFEWNSDNAIHDPEAGLFSPASIDIYGNKLSGDEDSGASLFKHSSGGYPPTVAAWMYKSLRDLSPQFKTVIVPEGYDTVAQALNDWEVKYEMNLERIELRKKFVDAFIDEFEMEERRTWPTKFATAASEMRAAIGQKIFIAPGDLTTNPDWPNYSGADRLWRIFNDKDTSIAGLSVGKNVSKWSDKNQRKAGTNGQSFVEAHGWKAALLELPDTSSADIKFHFEDFGEGTTSEQPVTVPTYQFELEYDYNLFDERGVLRKDNTYVVRIVETIDGAAAAAGGTSSRKEQRKSGTQGPPPSVVDEGPYTYTKHEVVSKSDLDEDVRAFLEELEVYNNKVSDSYEIEALYRFMSEAIIAASANPQLTRKRIIMNPAFRDYFAKTESFEETVDLEAGTNAANADLMANAGNIVTSQSAFDMISNGFLRRISTSISSGRTDFPGTTSADSTDSEPGFLEPPETTEATEDQKKSEEERAAEMALDSISPAFKFGHDPYAEPEIVFLDPSKYGGVWAQLAISMGRDPDTIPQPFYVEAQQMGGWMDMSQVLVPEVDGCDPARTHLYTLSDISDSSSQLGSSLTPDPRLNYDPLCTQEAPYDKVLEATDAGNIDGAIRASIRIYAVDIFIRAIPAFVMFGLTDENYDDLLLSFTADKIKQGLYEDGRKAGRLNNDYYYRILEQCVNNTVRKLDSGLLKIEDLTDIEQDALGKITTTVQNFYEKHEGQLEALSSAAISGQSFMQRLISPSANKKAMGLGAGSADFSKSQAKAAKKVAFEETIAKTESEATVFFKMYIREEFAKVRQMFADKIPSFVNNIHHLFLLSDAWVFGGVYGNGPFDVQSNPADRGTFNINLDLPPAVTEAAATISALGGPYSSIGDSITENLTEMNKGWPFVLEKYIRIEDKETSPKEVRKRSSNLFGVVNIKDWDTYVKGLKSEGVAGDISDFWGNAPLEGETTKIEEHTHNFEIDSDGNGLTSTYIDEDGNEHFHIIENFELQRAEMNPEDNGHTHDIEITGWKFGLRLNYLVEKEKNDVFAEIMQPIEDDRIMIDKAYTVESPEGPRYMVPIATAELPIPDQDFTLFDPDSYDVYCLIDELIKTVEYRTWFKYMFPLSRYTSLMAVYISQGFYASLGNSGYPADGGDLWEVAGGRKGVGPRFRKWARNDEEVYHRTRQEARDLFTSLYDAAGEIDFETENEFGYPDSPSSIRDLIRPRVNFEDGLRWWQRGRRISQRPYDMDGDECDE